MTLPLCHTVVEGRGPMDHYRCCLWVYVYVDRVGRGKWGRRIGGWESGNGQSRVLLAVI